MVFGDFYCGPPFMIMDVIGLHFCVVYYRSFYQLFESMWDRNRKETSGSRCWSLGPFSLVRPESHRFATTSSTSSSR